MKFICRPANADIYDIYIEYVKTNKQTNKKKQEFDVNTERSETCSMGFPRRAR